MGVSNPTGKSIDSRIVKYSRNKNTIITGAKIILNPFYKLNIFIMKNSLFKFLTIVMIVGFSANAMADGTVTASATATATIVTPLAITNAGDMNFGNIAVNATAGTVVLIPAGTTTATGGVTLPPTNPGTITNASFTVTGQTGYTYVITLEADGYEINDGGTNTMTIDDFTSTPSGTGELTTGTQTIDVGATLNVGASQAAGTYTNGTGFDVSVNYN